MNEKKHIPLRTCLGCGERSPQREMTRLVREPAGSVTIDPARQLGGRGGYLHKSTDCWRRFARRKGVVRSFRAVVDRSVRMALLAQFGLASEREG